MSELLSFVEPNVVESDAIKTVCCVIRCSPESAIKEEMMTRASCKPPASKCISAAALQDKTGEEEMIQSNKNTMHHGAVNNRIFSRGLHILTNDAGLIRESDN